MSSSPHVENIRSGSPLPPRTGERAAAGITVPAYVPQLRDRVRMRGSDEIFFVVYVDLRGRLVDLACAERVGFLSEVPFRSLIPSPVR